MFRIRILRTERERTSEVPDTDGRSGASRRFARRATAERHAATLNDYYLHDHNSRVLAGRLGITFYAEVAAA